MTRSKSKPKKGISPHKRSTPTSSISALYKSSSARKSKSSPTTDVSNSKQEHISDNPINTSKTNASLKRSSFTEKKSKRKSYLPSRRSITEEFKTASKSINITRFGKTEICSRKTWNDLKYYQKSTFLLIPRLPFSRVIHEILNEHGSFRISPIAIEAIQEAAEIYLVTLFTAANLSAAHAKRKTVKSVDMALSLFISRMNF